MVKTLAISLLLILCMYLQPISLQAQSPKIINLNVVSDHLDRATSLSITPSGTIYITESSRNRLLTISSDGIRSDSLGARGSGDYKFNSPVSVDATNGLKIYVADQNNGRVQLFDKRFQFLSSITADKIDGTSRFRPSQLQVSNSGDLFVYDSGRHVIYVFDPFGNFSRQIDLRNYRIGSGIHMKMMGSVLMILDTDAGVIHKFTADGGYMNFIGGFDGAIKIHAAESGIWALYADQVIQFSMQGEPLQVHTFTTSVSPEDLYLHQHSLYILSNNRLLQARVK